MKTNCYIEQSGSVLTTVGLCRSPYSTVTSPDTTAVGLSKEDDILSFFLPRMRELGKILLLLSIYTLVNF